MKIIQITPDFPPCGGGIGSYVYYLSKELIKLGHGINVIFRGTRDKIYDYNNIKVNEVKVAGWPPLNLNIFKKKIENILTMEKADIIHIHHGAMPIIKSKAPVLVTAHCCNKELIRSFHRPVRNLDALYRNALFPVYVKAETRLSKLCDKLTVVSESLRREFSKHYDVSSSVLHNGVDTNLFKPNENGDREDAVIFTGSLNRGKGVLDLLEIAQLLIESHSKIQIYIAGNGPLKNKLIRRIKNKNLSNVKLTNHLPHPQLVQFYQRSRIFVLPTYYEGLPTAVLEAMACKLPVVSTNISGIPDQIEDGINGYMVHPGDIHGFCEKIVELLNDEIKQKSFGEMGRKKIMNRFTWPSIGNLFVKEYNNLLKTSVKT